MFLDHLANTIDLVNWGIVNDKNAVWQWPFIHAWEEPLNKSSKVITHDGVLDNLKMEDSINGEGGENGVLDATIGELGAVGVLTMQWPCVQPPQSMSVEMRLICKDKLFWAEISWDEHPVLLAILLILLESRMCCLLCVGMRLDEQKQKRKGHTIFMVYPSHWRERMTICNDTSTPYTSKISSFSSTSDMSGCWAMISQRY